MKTLIGLSLLFCGLAVASDAEIYQAMDIEAYNPYPDMAGSYTYIKEIGGLSCLKEGVVYPGSEPSYTCTLERDYSGELIYEALNVEQYNPYPDMLGPYTYIKQVGGLVCLVEGVVYFGSVPSYTCVLGN